MQRGGSPVAAPSGEEMVEESGVPVHEDWSMAPDEDRVRFSLSGVTPHSWEKGEGGLEGKILVGRAGWGRLGQGWGLLPLGAAPGVHPDPLGLHPQHAQEGKSPSTSPHPDPVFPERLLETPKTPCPPPPRTSSPAHRSHGKPSPPPAGQEISSWCPSAPTRCTTSPPPPRAARRSSASPTCRDLGEGGGFRNQRPPPWGPLPGAVLGVGTHLETLFFSLSPGGAQSDRRSRGERARRGGRRPSLP